MEEFINSLSIYDYVGVGIISISILLGVTKGFVDIFGRVVSLVISFLVAKIFSLSITELVYSILGGREALYTKTLDLVQSQVEGNRINLESAITTAIDNSVIPLESLKVKLIEDTSFRLFIANESKAPIEDITMKIVETIEPIIIYVLSIAIFILLFIFIRIVTMQLTKVMNKIITGTKITGGADALLGGLVGAIRGVTIVIIIYYMLFLYVTVIGDLPFVDKEIFINSKLFTLIT